MIEKLSSVNETTRKFAQEVVDIVRNESLEAELKVTKLVNTFWNSNLLPEPTPPIQREIQESRHLNVKVTTVITNSLMFASIGDREEAIPEAHIKTFR